MDKQMYKEILSDSISETTYYKKIVEKVEQLVKDEPNDMQLGARIRSLYFTIKDDRDLANEKI